VSSAYRVDMALKFIRLVHKKREFFARKRKNDFLLQESIPSDAGRNRDNLLQKEGKEVGMGREKRKKGHHAAVFLYSKKGKSIHRGRKRGATKKKKGEITRPAGKKRIAPSEGER